MRLNVLRSLALPALLGIALTAGCGPVDSSRSSDVAAGGDGLREVEPALTEITTSQGPQRFRLLERVQLTTVGEERAETAGRNATVQQRATLLQDVVLADLEIEVTGHHRLQTHLKLKPDQIVVLAQTGVNESLRSSEFPAETLYYSGTSKRE